MSKFEEVSVNFNSERQHTTPRLRLELPYLQVGTLNRVKRSPLLDEDSTSFLLIFKTFQAGEIMRSSLPLTGSKSTEIGHGLRNPTRSFGYITLRTLELQRCGWTSVRWARRLDLQIPQFPEGHDKKSDDPFSKTSDVACCVDVVTSYGKALKWTSQSRLRGLRSRSSSLRDVQ
ncbi:hypothetical protein SCHPADRAFT_895380 [Schizopora paradoxa]|uniref:Uncharacterized protein n=1 Tax=Schizopora paradoxa TaxID=27342 RepID=A0A0H2R3W2_9AGAM|nr:hypothetical protein SCHPADRAFT_895380 [Schizopora paradoxa]